MMRSSSRAAVLLEVVFAMALFFLAAGVVAGGLHASMRAAKRVQTDAQGANLLVITISEIQMGLIPVASDGPNAFDLGPEGWTWQVIVTSEEFALQGPQMERVEVVVRNEATGWAYRSGLLMPDDTAGGLP